MQQSFNPKNENLFIWVTDRLYLRNEARVSVFDSSVQGGDAVWEGLRVYQGRIFCLNDHLQRLHESAHAMMFQNIPSKDEIKQAIFQTLKSNGMTDGVHIRLTLTRGEKITSGMDPRLNQSGCTLIVLAEWKDPVYDANGEKGISLLTSSVRRNSPLNIDSKIHHNNLINNILAKIEANIAGFDDALMLDLYGFVAETNACNIFMVKDEVLFTPNTDACLPGITRRKVIEIAGELSIPVSIKNLSLVEFYNADEVFASGTMGELTNVRMIDGREIVNRSRVSILQRIRNEFRKKTATEGELLPFSTEPS